MTEEVHAPPSNMGTVLAAEKVTVLTLTMYSNLTTCSVVAYVG